jgi:hypothetical protein
VAGPSAGTNVSDTGCFVYCNGQDARAFDGRIEFAVKLLPYIPSPLWANRRHWESGRCEKPPTEAPSV